MKMQPLLILGGTALLGGCVYPPTGYTVVSPYYYSYQPAYQPAYQITYQTTYPPVYQGYAYRPPPYPYPLYSSQFPTSGTSGSGGG